MGIEWRPALGFEGLYEVSADGQVRSLDRIVNGGFYRGILRKLSLRMEKGQFPYYYVQLSMNGKYYNRGVHRLVLEAFVGPCPDGMETCHRDGNGVNNTVANLYWGTHSENMTDMVQHGRNHLAASTECKYGHLWTPESTARTPEGHRRCRICRRLWLEKRRRAQGMKKRSAA